MFIKPKHKKLSLFRSSKVTYPSRLWLRKNVGDKYPPSNELTRSTTELVQHFRLEGELTSARERCLTWIWYGFLYRSPILVGRRGVITHSNDFYLPSLRLEEEGGGQHPVQISPTLAPLTFITDIQRSAAKSSRWDVWRVPCCWWCTPVVQQGSPCTNISLVMGSHR